ncbi:hypothetical protein BH09PAT1_BH09PAT1_2700 [soil metagenome]
MGITSKNKCTIIFINQMRANIGAYGNAPTEMTTGGKALRYYTSVRLDIRRIGAVKGSGEEVVGQKTRIKVIKNKLAAPHKEVETTLLYGKGFSREADLIDLALSEKVLTQKGAWIAYEGKNISQGRMKLIELLETDKELFDKIYADVQKGSSKN